MSLVLAILAAQAASAQTCAGDLCDPSRLRPFLEKLRRSREGGRPVRILQIGDSHTAGDQITGSWRSLLQSRHGYGGRGVLAPGRPYPGYLTRGVTVRQSPGWSIDGIFGSAWHGPSSGPIGLSGYSATSTAAGASMSLSTTPEQSFDRLTVCAVRRPGAGSLTLTAGDVRSEWVLAAQRMEPDCRTVDTPSSATEASVTADGPVTITSWSTERRSGGGVVLSNLGTVGAQFVHAERMSDDVIRREAREYAPDLLVIAFGTNEAFWPAFGAANYARLLRAGLERAERLFPGTPVLLLGAPDSATRNPLLLERSANDAATCPTDVASAISGEANGASGASAPTWTPSRSLAAVQSIQRQVAHETGSAFWDWSRAMDGRCSTSRWTADALMRPDHVHFTKAGAAIVAERLQRDLEEALRPDRDGDAG